MLRTVALVTIAAVSASATGVLAGQCAPRDEVVNQLNAKFGETRHSIGLAPNNSVIEVFASDSSGTFTITVTNPKGVTCLMASGEAYEKISEPLPKEGNPT